MAISGAVDEGGFGVSTEPGLDHHAVSTATGAGTTMSACSSSTAAHGPYSGVDMSAAATRMSVSSRSTCAAQMPSASLRLASCSRSGGQVNTYGLGMSLRQLIRDPLNAGGSVELAG